MNARGTRRPHAKRVRSKPVRMKRGGGGGGSKNTGCGLFLVALITLPTLVAAVVR